MLWTFKRKSPIVADIDNFLAARGAFSTTRSYAQYLYMFVKVTGVERVDDIREYHRQAFLSSVKDVTSSEHSRLTASMALNVFMRYMTNKEEEHLRRFPLGRKPNMDRNIKLVNLRDSDPHTYTFDKLGERFSITKKRAYEIYNYTKEALDYIAKNEK